MEVDNEIKVSFLEMGPASFNVKENTKETELIETNPKVLVKKSNPVKKSIQNNTKIFTVQIGIFSDEKKTKQLSRQINNIGFKTQIKKINLSGQKK